MLKIPFLKNNKAPTLVGLHKKATSPGAVWIIIILTSVALVFICALYSLYISVRLLNNDPFVRARDTSLELSKNINVERLEKAVQIIKEKQNQF
ncbi:MAG TPA: hypothetical protein VJH67_02395 [Candidatus Paceibacterota bacterium]